MKSQITNKEAAQEARDLRRIITQGTAAIQTLQARRRQFRRRLRYLEKERVAR